MVQKSDRIYIGSDLGGEARNERGLAETVDDTQGMEVGETRKVRYHEICVLSSTTCVCLQIYRYILRSDMILFSSIRSCDVLVLTSFRRDLQVSPAHRASLSRCADRLFFPGTNVGRNRHSQALRGK